MLVFEKRGNWSTCTQRKPLGAEERTNKLNPHMTPDLGTKPRPHWWEASALTTVPSLHPALTQSTTNQPSLSADGGVSISLSLAICYQIVITPTSSMSKNVPFINSGVVSC